MKPQPVPGDVLNHVAGIEPDSYLASLRGERPNMVEHTQATFLAIFEPDDDAHLSRPEREATALWVATLAKAPEVAAFHRARLIAHGKASEHLAAIGATVDAQNLSPREQALLKHAEMLALRPSSATREDIQALLNVEISAEAIVTLAQLVAFISFELRTIATLRALQGEAFP